MIKNIANLKNIYGKTPLDLALQYKNDKAISLLAPDKDINDLKKDEKYGYHPIRIHQANVTKTMLYRLKLKYRSTEFFSKEGNCNGFAFLRTLYAARGLRQYYFDTLALMANWDGEESTLHKDFYTGEKPSAEEISRTNQTKYYKNLDNLFEQWTSDLIWFQHSTLGNIDALEQHDRGEQYNLIKDKEVYECLFLNAGYTVDLFIGSADKSDILSLNQSRERLAELIHYLMKMPKQIHFEIGGSRHATSAFIDEQGLFDYYDPNFRFDTDQAADFDKNIQRILDYKYTVLRNQYSLYTLNLQIFCFKKDFYSLNIDQFEIFDRSSLPVSRMEVETFKANSPNQFTQLHVAVITKSLPCIKQLLADGYCKIDDKDKKLNTPLNIAINNKYQEAVELFLNQPDLESSVKENALYQVYNNDMRDFTYQLLKRFSDLDISRLFLRAIDKGDIDLIKEIYKKGRINLNKAYDGGGLFLKFLPLIKAMERNKPEIVNYLLENKADVFLSDGNTTPLELAMKRDSFYFDVITENLPDINMRDKNGETALYYSVLNLNEDAISKLLKKGADPTLLSSKNKDIFDSLYSGYSYKNSFLENRKNVFLACLKLLASTLDKTDMVAIIAFLQSLKFMEIFISILDIFDKNTILMTLVEKGSFDQKYDLIPLMIKYGANLDFKNKEGKTVIELVQESSDALLTEIFREHHLLPEETNFRVC